MISDDKLDERGVKDFRNKVAGHIFDKKLNRPLTSVEIDARLSTVFGDSEESFLMWINNPQNNVFPRTIIAVCEHTRDRIQTEYRLQPEEIFPADEERAPSTR